MSKSSGPVHSRAATTLAAVERAMAELRRGGIVVLRDEDGAIASPGAFMPAVERYHLSARVDEWVIVNTLRWLQGRPALCAEHLQLEPHGSLPLLLAVHPWRQLRPG